MLKIIKIYTIRVLQQAVSEDEEEDEDNKARFDVFSQHIYVPEVNANFSRDLLHQQSSIEVLSELYAKIPEVSFKIYII